MSLDELPYPVYKDKGVQLASFRLQSVQKSVSAKRGVGVRRVGGWYCVTFIVGASQYLRE